MAKIKRIFIDLDGPLLCGKERHYFCYRTILERFGFEPIGVEQYWEMKRARVIRGDLLRISGADGIYDQFVSSWLVLIESPEALLLDKPQAGAFNCLLEWKQRGIEIALVTLRNNHQALLLQLERLGFHSLLDVVLVSKHSLGALGKADVVQKFCSNQKCDESDLWIGDTEVDWEAASILGCKIILLANGLRSRGYLKSLRGAIVKPSIEALKGHF